MKSREDWRHRLVVWYAENHRDLPWRRTRNPYAIWVSEIMLQQTQVTTVIPYFQKWMERFPNIEALTESTEEDVLEIWQGLGYYRRAKLLRSGAQYVRQHSSPKTYEGWLKVPGVGPYTAAAISSISENYPAAVVDGNVERVFARLTACEDVGTPQLKKARQWAYEVLDTEHPGDWNQAVMELGATICSPRNPKCEMCPVATACAANKLSEVGRYPVRATAPQIVRERHVVWVPYFEGRFGVRRIAEGPWWVGLWEFPRADQTDDRSEKELKRLAGEGWLESVGKVRHQVTNHRIMIDAHLLRCETASPMLSWQTHEELRRTPMPSPQRKVLAKALQALGLPNPD